MGVRVGDKAVKERVDARNSCEGFLYNLRNQLDDEISEEDREKLDEAVREALDWLDENPEAEKEEYEEKQKEVEAISNPIIQEVYAQSGGAPGGEEDGGDDWDEEEDDFDDGEL